MVTWGETGDVRNRVEVVEADGTAVPVAPIVVEAGRPNRSGLPGFGGLPIAAGLRVAVTVLDEDDAVISEAGLSPIFDTNRPPVPVIETVTPREDGTARFTWRPGAVVDSTPGDPLDVPVEEPQLLMPVATYLIFNGWDDLADEPTTDRSAEVTADRMKPYYVGVKTQPNEWVPPGGKLTVTGKSVSLVRVCDAGPCWWVPEDDAGRLLRLQSRAGRSAAWQTVATTRALANGTFVFAVKFPGAGDYRVVAPPVVGSESHDALAYFAAAGGLLVVLGALLALAGRGRRRAFVLSAEQGSEL
ncbi:hypothetical protein [Paractinoplanes atraurantiacus]|uniref:Uncharacterized protein n=1 Tax=Paractinoplanes atraurantiacus TaxID=1036182 RepID=A0A285FUJ0_9ACTN|nr:hypothetical protein [Actinoplanes atraurantiacus]SNY14957.1 hypothetical protein SAMN05421748_1011250 [Actinoplanes atraurantiacus]